MFRKYHFHTLGLLLLSALLFLSGCAPLLQPVTVSGTAPTPEVSYEQGGVDNPDVFVDARPFREALLQALNAGDAQKLQMWMAEPVLTGVWRTDLSESSPAEAIKKLYDEELGSEIKLVWTQNVDLQALLGGADPLSIPRSDAGVTEAFLVSGWGKDGGDEAILYITRGPADDLKWYGWLRIPGGFSGARLGGVQAYQNEAQGYSLFAPKGDEVSEANETETVILAPGQGHPGEGRAAAFILIEPAEGRTAEQVVQALQAELGSGFNLSVTAINIEDAQALVVSGLPGQDSNRQLFMVHGDRLYHMTFVPDGAQFGEAYQQMEDIFAMVVNTFHFL